MAAMRWRVPVRIPAGKLIVAGVLALLAVAAATEPWQVVAAGVAVAALAAWAARDLLIPVRLAADDDGLVLVTGLAGRKRLAWSQVDQVCVDVRHRSRMLEVDAGESLYLISRYDVDADLDEIAARLEHLRLAGR